MKIRFTLVSFFILLLFSINTFARAIPSDPYEIAFKQRRFTPPANVQRDPTPQHGSNAELSRHMLVQFHSMPSVEQLHGLGVQPLQWVAATTVAARVPNTLPPELRNLIRWHGELLAQDKFTHAAFAQLNQSGGKSKQLLVEAYPDVTSDSLVQQIQLAGGRVIAHPSLPPNIKMVRGLAQVFEALSELSLVNWISVPAGSLTAGLPTHYCPGVVTPFGPVANYVTLGDGWEGSGKHAVTLQYYFTNGTPDLPDAVSREEVHKALLMWARYVNIKFLPTDIAAQPFTIDIAWEQGAHEDPLVFDGIGGALAHAFFNAPVNAEPLAGDLHFDEAELWATQLTGDWWTAPEKHLFTVALHEIGHSLGVDHSDVVGSVMNAYYEGIAVDLHADDISAIQSLYASTLVQPYIIQQANTQSQFVEVISLSGVDNLQSLIARNSTMLPADLNAAEHRIRLAHYNGDSLPDVWQLDQLAGPTNSPSLVIVDGNGHRRALLKTALPLPVAEPEVGYDYVLGDYNADQLIDLYVLVKTNAADQFMRVAVLDGSSKFQQILFEGATILPATGVAANYQFELGDQNKDGKPDLYVIERPIDGMTPMRVGILNGASNFADYLQMSLEIGLIPAAIDSIQQVELGHFDFDGELDLFVLNTVDSTPGLMDLSVLSGHDSFQTLLATNSLPLQKADTNIYEFAIANYEAPPRIAQPPGGCALFPAYRNQMDPSLPLLFVGSLTFLWFRNLRR